MEDNFSATPLWQFKSNTIQLLYKHAGVWMSWIVAFWNKINKIKDCSRSRLKTGEGPSSSPELRGCLWKQGSQASEERWPQARWMVPMLDSWGEACGGWFWALCVSLLAAQVVSLYIKVVLKAQETRFFSSGFPYRNSGRQHCVYSQ